MKKKAVQFEKFMWIDIEKPDEKGLSELSKEIGLNEKMVRLTLDPEYLPKVHFLGEDELFLVFRVIDPKPRQHADSIPELTTKVSFYIKDQFIVSLHRQKLEFLDTLFSAPPTNNSQTEFLSELIWQVVQTFDGPLLALQTKLDQFDERIFSQSRSKRLVREGYFLKRHSTSFKKVLKFTLDNVNKLSERGSVNEKRLQESKDYLERLIFYAEDVFENVTSLLNIYISLVSQKTNEASLKTNEVMRVLTVFSLFFLPLNFVAGIYGMNFDYMPELQNPHGYYMILTLMFLFSVVLFVYVWKKGWLKSSED